MHCVLLLVYGVVAIAAYPKFEGVPKCGRVTHGGMLCCNKEKLKMTPTDEMKECFQMPRKPPPSCDLDICLAKKRGIASDDGTIDKKKMADYIETLFENDPELADNIKMNCVFGDLSKYGPEDFCDLMKQKMCIDVQIVKNCDDWNDEGDCKGMKELAEECIKQF